jgi:hypothetical protein
MLIYYRYNSILAKLIALQNITLHKVVYDEIFLRNVNRVKFITSCKVHVITY